MLTHQEPVASSNYLSATTDCSTLALVTCKLTGCTQQWQTFSLGRKVCKACAERRKPRGDGERETKAQATHSDGTRAGAQQGVMSRTRPPKSMAIATARAWCLA